MKDTIGKKNISFGWIWLLIGLVMGAIMGLWSFNGPLPSPVGDYTSLPRRMLRLSHIAFVGLSFLNMLFGYQVDRLVLTRKLKKSSSMLLIGGSVLMPLILFLAVFNEAFKYLLPIPAMMIIASLVIVAIGIIKK